MITRHLHIEVMLHFCLAWYVRNQGFDFRHFRYFAASVMQQVLVKILIKANFTVNFHRAPSATYFVCIACSCRFGLSTPWPPKFKSRRMGPYEFLVLLLPFYAGRRMLRFHANAPAGFRTVRLKVFLPWVWPVSSETTIYTDARSKPATSGAWPILWSWPQISFSHLIITSVPRRLVGHPNRLSNIG